MSLDGKVLIVTGAAGNVGRAAVALLAGRGASVVAVDRGAPPPGDAHLPLNGRDLADPRDCAAVVEAALARFGRLDGAVNTVGAFGMAGLAEGDDALWDAMFGANLRTTLNLFRAVAPTLREAGRGGLVAIGAGAALRAGSGMAAYAASKAAVLRLVESAAEELKGAGVRVNAVLPGTIDTPQNRAAMPGADTAKWVTPEQVAEAILFLLSDAASGITGALPPVTGRA